MIPKIDIFKEKLNEFSEQLKDVSKFHAEHITKISQSHSVIQQYHKHIKSQLVLENDIADNIAHQNFVEMCQIFEKQMAVSHAQFKLILKDNNAILGSFSNQWGSHLEQIAVAYFLETLRAEFEVHTWFQKFKRYWHKSQNVEIDLLAHNDETAYIIEVKNQLKIEHQEQIEKIKTKLETHVPEFNHLKKQFIIMCFHCDKNIVEQFDESIWILKFNDSGTLEEDNTFLWERKSLY